jgi:hypothetical protein
MANEDVQKLVAVVEARSAAAEKQMERFVRAADRRMAEFEKRASQAAVKVEKRMASAFGNASNAVKRFAGFVATTAGLTVSFNRIVESAKRLDDLGDTAQRLGTSAGELVKWRSALELAGGEMESFAGAADAFQGKIGAVIGNIGKTKATRSALGILGISVDDIQAASTLQSRLTLIAEAISQVGDRATRAAIADKLGLRPMLPLLEQGRAGVEKLTGQFDELGLKADEAVGRTGDLADKMKLLQQELQLKSDNLFVRLGPIISGIYDQISNLLDLLDNPLLQMILGNADPVANARMSIAKFGSNSGTDAIAGIFGPQAATSDAAKKARKALDDSLDAVFDARAKLANLEKQRGPGGQAGAFIESLISGAKKTLTDAENAKAAASAALTAAEKAAETIAAAGRDRPDKVNPVVVDLEDEEEAVGKVATAYKEATKAKTDWATLMGGAGSAAFMAGTQINSVVPVNDLKESFRSAFRFAFQQLTEGDVGGAAATFAGAFAEKLQDRVSDQLFDFVWDSLGLGDVAGQLFGPLDAAQAAQAATTVQATTALAVFTNALYAAAAAAGSSGGGGGLLGGIVSAVLGGLGAGNVAGAGAGGFSAGIAGALGRRASGGPVAAGTPYIVGEKRPEVFVPNTAGYIVPRVPSAVSRGGGQSLTFAPVINAPGADPAAITRLETMMQRAQNEFRNFAAGEKSRTRANISDLGERRALASGSA